jgi:hypothetical protein
VLHWAQPHSTFGEGLSKDEIQSAHMEKDSETELFKDSKDLESSKMVLRCLLLIIGTFLLK